MAQFLERLKGLLPQIKARPQVKFAPGSENEKGLDVVANAAAAFAKKNDFAKANQLLDAVRTLLAKAGAAAVSSGDDAGFRQRWLAAKQAWQTASDLVDDQIAKLQAVLRKEADEELHEIADKGLNAVTGNHKVPLLAAIRDIDAADAAARTALAKTTQAIITGFRKHLEGDMRVAVCDENPFGVPMSIRTSLGGALAELSKALAAA